jgi:hypothetical protein
MSKGIFARAHYKSQVTIASTINMITNQRAILILIPAIFFSPSKNEMIARTKKVKAQLSKPAIYSIIFE